MNGPRERTKDNLAGLAGKRLTPKRLLLLDLLREGEHLDAEGLYQQAKLEEPHINLSTVYRNLKLFCRMGLVDEIWLAKSGTRYFEASSHDRHYHAICLKCGRILNFNNPLIEEVKKAVEDETEMVITNVRLSMTGYCASCREAHKNF
jgi:Fur family ferric uptake transcriptional regulator